MRSYCCCSASRLHMQFFIPYDAVHLRDFFRFTENSVHIGSVSVIPKDFN
jgi:hypothetical protein